MQWQPHREPGARTRTGSRRLLATAALLALVAGRLPAKGPDASRQPSTWEWDDVSRVVAIGDLHGSHRKLAKLLIGAGLVDSDLTWSGGEDHLVITGDFIDRGVGDRPLMDLLRKLQSESSAAGGWVHVLLGNHEVMNLLRDNRYVNPKTYNSFREDERKEVRNRAWRAFSAATLESPGSAALQEFNRRFPVGSFGRLMAFNPEGEYGGWLLDQPVIVKINGVVYLHAGLSEEFAALGVDGINLGVTAELVRHLAARRVLETEGIVTPVMDLTEIGAAAMKLVRRDRGPSNEARVAAEVLLESADSPILRSRGPLWYRGNSFEDERIESITVERSLELIGARAMVIAHSPTRGNKITSRFQGRLFRVDHAIEKSDRPLVLVVEGEEVRVLDPSTGEMTRPVRELPPGTFYRPDSGPVPDGHLLEFLAESAVIESRDLGRGSTRPLLVVLEHGDKIRRGVFKTVQTTADPASGADADRYQHEVAAYRLDRTLGLGMVPVTVIREIDHQVGSLQWWIERAIDRKAAETYELSLYDSEITDRELELGEMFDALIGNRDRKPSDILLSLQGGRLRLIDHSRAFSTSWELEWNGEGMPIAPRLAKALRALDRGSLEAALGSLLDERQIDAVLVRRDKILARVEVVPPAAPTL